MAEKLVRRKVLRAPRWWPTKYKLRILVRSVTSEPRERKQTAKRARKSGDPLGAIVTTFFRVVGTGGKAKGRRIKHRGTKAMVWEMNRRHPNRYRQPAPEPPPPRVPDELAQRRMQPRKRRRRR